MPPPRTSRPFVETLPPLGLAVFESHHADDFTMSPRSHAFYKAIYVLAGAGTLVARTAAPLSFQAGDVVLVPAGLMHRIVDDGQSPSSLYVACLQPEWFAFDRDVLTRWTFCVIRDPHVTHRAAVILRRMLHRQNASPDTVAKPHRSLSIVADAMRLAETLLDPGPTTRHRHDPRSTDQRSMASYAAHLRQNFFEATDIDDAARSMQMSRRHFTKLFRETTGTTWLSFVRDAAIGHAKERLRCDDVPITSVAFECGFADLTTFYRQFKARVGCSPARYRRGQRVVDADRPAAGHRRR